MDFKKLSKIFDDLFPILRSITGPGYIKSLRILGKYIDFEYKKYRSVKKIFDWSVPNEWHFNYGYIQNLKGKKIKLYAWNVHGGLSPWYRGGATLFWPTYMLQPEYTGMTFHETTEKVDAGNIVYQNSAKLREEDGIHENACRLIKDFCDKLPFLLERKLKKKLKLKA